MNCAAVVTGASNGIGAAIVNRLVADGWFVVGIDLVRTWLDGDHQVLVLGDVTDAATIATATDAVPAGTTLTGWVNNAAVAIPGRLDNAQARDVRRTLAVNVEAYFWCSAAAVHSFLGSRVAGTIVNVSSIQATAAFPGWAAYVTSKGAIEALTRYTAIEYGRFGIRCNAVAPGNVRTSLAAAVVEEAADPVQMADVMEGLAPLDRMAEPAEIAAAVAYLLGPESSFVSGHTLTVDGGATARCFPMNSMVNMSETDSYLAGDGR